MKLTKHEIVLLYYAVPTSTNRLSKGVMLNLMGEFGATETEIQARLDEFNVRITNELAKEDP